MLFAAASQARRGISGPRRFMGNQVAGRGVGPTTGSRLMAMLSTTIYDTVCAFNNTYKPYKVDVSAPRTISLEAAVAGAAQRVLSSLLPGQRDYINEQLRKSVFEIKGTSRSIRSGLAFGANIADRSMALRVHDGADNNAPYIPNATTGYVWQPAAPGQPNAGVALGPNWGSVTPWVLSPSQLGTLAKAAQLEARPDKNAVLYAQQIEEVREVGALQDTPTTMLSRTADQTEIAKFWAYDRPDTFRPYGQLNQISLQIATSQHNSLEQNASLFASLNTALADSVIVAWGAKYREQQPRPYDVITGYANIDNNPATIYDPNWHSLLSSINGSESPPFPDYLSGHSSMGGAFASVMTNFFGDNIIFSATSAELPGISRKYDGFNENGVFYNGFYEAGMENALSRIYGGVHIREACEDAFTMGFGVGSLVASQQFGLVGGFASL
jgi:hypothetical protein